MANPTIPIKKPDGSIVKVTMPEFLEFKKTGVFPSTAGSVDNNSQIKEPLDTPINFFDDDLDQPIPEYNFFDQEVEPLEIETKDVHQKREQHTDAPLVAVATQALSTTTPVNDVFINEAKAKATPWTKDDHTSLISETIQDTDVSNTMQHAALPPTRDEMVDPVLEKAQIVLDESLHARVRSLIISRIKEIRDDAKVLMYARQSVDDGGLGLTDQQSQTLLVAIKEVMHLQPLPNQNMASKSILAKPIFHDQQKTRAYTPQPTPLVGNSKPMLHDITVAQSTNQAPYRQVGSSFETMGPIDEIARFTQLDLQRLGSEKLRVISIMQSKFEVLKEESYVLFLDAVDAWLHSPLYKQYQQLVVAALNNKKTINQVIQESGTMLSMKDLDIIVEVNKIAR